VAVSVKGSAHISLAKAAIAAKIVILIFLKNYFSGHMSIVAAIGAILPVVAERLP
jgi:hypothetical protein